MTLPFHPCANPDTTPLHLPIATLLPSQTNTHAGDIINASKRPRLVDDIPAEYFQHQEAFYEHGPTVETQLQQQQQQQQQQHQQHLHPSEWTQLQEQTQFQQLQQLQLSQQSDEILTDGAGFLPFCYPYLPELAPEEPQFISPHINHEPLHHPEQQLTPHLNHQHLHHPAGQASPPSPTLAFDPILTFHHSPVPMSSVVNLSPGAFQQQQQQQHPLPTALMGPPPPPPPPKPRTHTHRPRAPMTSTSASAAAALSSSSSASVAALAFAASSSSSSASVSTSTLRIGGYTLEEAGIRLPPGLSDAERLRRLRLIAEELHHEATHPPVLPPSQVPDLPDKAPPVKLPKMTPGMTPSQRAATSAEILRLSQAQKRADQSRNNLAAKKSRLLRIECIDDTRLQLNAKSAECIWLRAQIIALSGAEGSEVLRRLRPSEAWGGFDYVYRARSRSRRRQRRQRRRMLTLMEDENDRSGPLIKVEDVMEENGDEDEGEDEDGEEDEPDVEGIVPRRVKEAITEEIRARVEAHREAVEEDSKRRMNASRNARRSEAAVAEAAANGGRLRRGSGGGKRKQ